MIRKLQIKAIYDDFLKNVSLTQEQIKLLNMYINKESRAKISMELGMSERTPGYNTYGRYNNYGARGYDMKYRGYDHLDRLSGEYNRYNESRERYGNNEDTDKSYHYMIKALEDFIMVLHEEAETPQQKQMLNETLQRSMR